MTTQSTIPGEALPIEEAQAATDEVRQELAIAGAELHLTNTALEHSLPRARAKGDVEKALAHNEVIEEKVTQAAQDLAHVTRLLKKEVAQRHVLERRLAAQRG